jgi:NAD(P)-dependent dehydrogenase (short-subunit alcohol dehydrogenase family)
MTSALVVGATGRVGRGITEVLLRTGWDVVAVGRDAARLADLASSLPPGPLTTFRGSLETAESTQALVDGTGAGAMDAVIITPSAPWEPRPVAACTWDEIVAHLERDLRPHVNAARAIIPSLHPDALYLALGGGMADWAVPGLAPVAMAQAAERSYLRAWHKEHRDGAAIRELIVAAMVRGHNADEAGPDALSSLEIAERVLQILTDPAAHRGPILTISVQDRLTTP